MVSGLTRDEEFELLEWKRDEPLITRQLREYQGTGEQAYIAKFQGQLDRTRTAIARLKAKRAR